jgi:glycopeptide antibiotics resistance protein
LKIVFFPIPINVLGFDANYNLIPFAHLNLKNVIGNIILFVPLGCYLPLAYEKLQSLKWMLIISFCSTISIEAAQGMIGVLISRRYWVVDINDAILNILELL